MLLLCNNVIVLNDLHVKNAEKKLDECILYHKEMVIFIFVCFMGIVIALSGA